MDWFSGNDTTTGRSDSARDHRQKTSQVFHFFFMAFISIGMAMAHNSTANSATLKVTRRVVVPIDLTPTDIRLGSDGNYIVTGTLVDVKGDLVEPAAAIKLTPEGGLIWKYASPLVDPTRYPATTQSYTNSIEMDDGSVFLCGHLFNVPEIGIKKAALLLTHLDSDGNLISEKNFPLGQYQSVGTCAKWGDGLVVIGGESQASSEGFKSAADLRYFNKDGKLIWERKFTQPSGNERNVISKDFLYLLSGDDVRDKTDYRIPAPEFGLITITRVSNQGEVKTLGQVKGFLGTWGKIAEPTSPLNDSDIFMVGVAKPSEYESKNPNRVVVKFDSGMKELSRVQTTKPAQPVSFQRIFSQPDGSLFYFGSVAKPFSDLPHMGVAYTSADFSHQAELAIVPEDFDDFPYVNVATSTGELNKFVTANRLPLKGLFKDNKGTLDSNVLKKFPPSTSPGTYLVLQFIQLDN
jgi:hypothetical protein